MSKPKLSICIPTHNRQKYLRDTINSIAIAVRDENYEKVEICISDNSSTDGTAELINEIRPRSPIKINYIIQEKNLGADRNYLSVVEMASGDYCWFLGSDDMMVGNAIEEILYLFDRDPDIVIVERYNCDLLMSSRKHQKWLPTQYEVECFDISKSGDLLKYLNKCDALGGIFSYLSSIIFKRKSWKESFNQDYGIGTLYVHVFKILGFLKSSCHLIYVPLPLVLSRGGNDSFAKDGPYKRAMIDLNGYLDVAAKISETEDIRDAAKAVFRRENKPLRYLSSIRSCSDSRQWSAFKIKAKKMGYSSFLIFIIGQLWLPLYFVRKIIKKVRAR